MEDEVCESSVFVSIVIPTWNRCNLLRDLLLSLADQTYPQERFEVIVADDGSADDTATLMADGLPQLIGLRYVRIAHSGPNVARNAGIAASRGKVICLLDDDEIVPPGWLATVVDILGREREVAVVGGPYKTRGKLGFRSCRRCAESVGVTTFPAHGGWLGTGNIAIRREAFDSVGLLEPAFTRGFGEDVEWVVRAVKAGLHTQYDDRMWILHQRDRQSLFELCGKSFRQGLDMPLARQVFPDNPWGVRSSARYLMRASAHVVRHGCLAGLIGVSDAVGRFVGEIRPKPVGEGSD